VTLRPGRATYGNNPVRIVEGAGRAPDPIWTGMENLPPTGVRSPDRPASDESLYRQFSRPTIPDIDAGECVRPLNGSVC